MTLEMRNSIYKLKDKVRRTPKEVSKKTNISIMWERKDMKIRGPVRRLNI